MQLIIMVVGFNVTNCFSVVTRLAKEISDLEIIHKKRKKEQELISRVNTNALVVLYIQKTNVNRYALIDQEVL